MISPLRRVGAFVQSARLRSSTFRAPKAQAPDHFDPVDAPALLKDVATLSRVYPDRLFGTKVGHAAADYVAGRMKEAGLLPVCGGGYFQIFEETIAGRRYVGKNVIGLLPGSDPALADEVVIVSAHHDSQADTNQGANDNATGCAVVLALAAELKKNPPKRSVLFVTFDGEEGVVANGHYNKGRQGSRHYAANPVLPLDKTAFLLNMDMLGRVHLESGDRETLYHWASHHPLAQSASAAAAAASSEQVVLAFPDQPHDSQFFRTDTEPFYRLGIPTVNFNSGRDLDNHSVRDVVEAILPSRVEKYARLGQRIVEAAANDPTTIAERGPPPGGLMPEFPLIQLRSRRSLLITTEEKARLDGFKARMPEIAEVAMQAARALLTPEGGAIAGLAWENVAQLSGSPPDADEPTVAALRELRRSRIEAYRHIAKNDVQRAAAQSQLAKLSAAEDVLAQTAYLRRLSSEHLGYYFQRVPDALVALRRGCEGLGFASLATRISEEDMVPFKARVSVSRGVEIGRRMVDDLDDALLKTAHAFANPLRAASEDRPLGREDLAAMPKGPARAFGGLALQLSERNFQAGRLSRTSTLAQVRAALRELRAQALQLPESGQNVAAELAFFSGVLEPYAKLEEARGNGAVEGTCVVGSVGKDAPTALLFEH